MCLCIIPERRFAIEVRDMSYRFLTIYKRDLHRYLRFKDQLLSSLLQPVLWVAFFGMAMAGNFDRILGTGSSAGVLQINYLTFMCAGITAATVLFMNIYGGFFILFDKKWGILREVMASPMPRRDLIIGIAMSSVTKSWIQALIILIFGLVLGVTFFTGQSIPEIVFSLIGVLAFVAVFAIAFLCISLTIALKIDSPEGFQGVATLLTMPLFFVSNSLYPIDGLPSGIMQLAMLNPLTHLTTGLRYFTIGDHYSAIGMVFTYVPSDIIFSFCYLLGFAAVMFIIAWKTVENAIVT